MIDAVVVSYNSRDTLRAAVEPLLALPGVDVTVVDNASSDGSLESIADLDVRALESGRNGGFGFGCNLGAAAGDAEYVLFINPDARISADDLARLSAVLDSSPSVGLVGPQLREEDGALIPSMRRYQRLGSTWATALFLHRFVRRAAWANEIIHEESAYSAPASPEWLSGACMLVRRSVFEALGGFDERFFLYCEDMDLCRRVWASGSEVRYEPAATARHEGGHSAPRTSLFAILAESRTAFARKHSGIAIAMLTRLGLAVHAATHALVASAARRPAHRQGNVAALRAVVRARG
ncbi:glycosyltransferase family 2 protein [Baekduia sp. Peel2402]|uniref:glycosyltransferase family 2 protein n=1 Tax=Baekduia sp. Peel2402 TaxID=3458296 RepID=UPI00403EDAEF